MMISATDREFLASNLDEPMDNILKGLGQSLWEEEGLGGFPPSVEKCIELAKEELKRERIQICHLLLSNNLIRGMRDGGKTYGRLEAACVTVDILRTTMNKPTCLWAAIYIVKYGLKSFCPDSETHNS